MQSYKGLFRIDKIYFKQKWIKIRVILFVLKIEIFWRRLMQWREKNFIRYGNNNGIISNRRSSFI